MRLLYEARVAALVGTGFKGPPHYFGDNTNAATKRKNRLELKRREGAGECFQCTVTQLQRGVNHIDCPFHGRHAGPGPHPTVPRDRA